MLLTISRVASSMPAIRPLLKWDRPQEMAVRIKRVCRTPRTSRISIKNPHEQINSDARPVHQAQEVARSRWLVGRRLISFLRKEPQSLIVNALGYTNVYTHQ